MAKEYLDKSGLTYFWGKCKEHFQPKYPIGSVYESVNNVNPSTYFGGTWQAIDTGNYIVTDSTSGVTSTYKWVRTA